MMELTSLALKTDLIFNTFSGEVIDRGNYLVVRTPSRPRYFWGNYLIMNRAPAIGDAAGWIDLFEREIGSRDKLGFVAITWDTHNEDPGDTQQFVDLGFSVRQSVVLTAERVHCPPKFNPDMIVRRLESESDWRSYIDIHYIENWEYGSAESQRQFLMTECSHLKAMVDCGAGARFGVELHDRLIAEAGLYWHGSIGRFSNVATHRDYRRHGACSTLIYQMSQYALQQKGLKTLVMEADEGYHAARIYESVGFRPTERHIGLEWYDKSMF